MDFKPGAATDSAAITRLEELARQLWPDAVPSRSELAALVASGVSLEPGAHAQDVLLAFQCARQVPGALLQLEQVLTALTREMARRSSPDQADEVVQRVRERLLIPGPGRTPAITAYAGKGSLKAWLRVAVLRTASNLRREETARAPDSTFEAEVLSLQATDPELALLKGRERALLATSIQEAFQELSVEERNLLRLHLIDGLGLDRLARLHRIHRATAARQVASARARLRDRVLEKIQGTLRLEGAELKSWLRIVRSELAVSVRKLLEEPKPGT